MAELQQVEKVTLEFNSSVIKKKKEKKIIHVNTPSFFMVKNIAHKMIWTWLQRGNLKREIESLLIVAQNNPIRSYVKTKIDYSQKNSKY